MCYKCIDRVSKMKQCIRRSTDNSISARSTTNEVNVNNNNNVPVEEKMSLSNIMTQLNEMKDSLTKINQNNDELKHFIEHRNPNDDSKHAFIVSTIEQKFTSLQADIDHHLSSQTGNDSLIIQKLDSLRESIALPTSYVKNPLTVKNVNTSVINRNRINSNSSADPLNCSFSFNQSTVPNDNAELYQLLSSFEQNTWTAFDYLRHKLNENTNTVLNIESLCNDISSKNAHQQELVSPVINSIKLDTLQTVHDKCEAIESKLHALDVSLKAFLDVEHPPLSTESAHNSTQRLHKRLQNLISTNDLLDSERQDAVLTPSTDDLSNYPVIDELLTVPTLHNTNSSIDLTRTTHHKLVSSSLSKDKYEFYVTKFSTNTTAQMIHEYIRKRGVNTSDSTKVSCLVPRNKDRSTLTFLSFKIDTDAAVAKVITSPGFWPSLCTIKEFVHKSVVNLSSDIGASSVNFLSPATMNLTHL